MTGRTSSFEAIGTRWDITIKDAIKDDAWFELIQKIYLRIQAFDKAYSRFRSDSLVTYMSGTPGTYELPPDGFDMLTFYKQLYEATQGKVTPLIGQALSDAGYDANYSFKEKTLHHPPLWEDALSFDKHSIEVKRPALLDFGAAGKGYLIDIVGDLIDQADIHSYTINAGGDILHRTSDTTALEVGLENPVDTTEAVGIVQLHNRSLCASAGSRRKWGKFHHIIDPIDLQSPSEVIATWVIADTTMLADGLATALFFTSPDSLSQRFNFSFAVLYKDMSIQRSKDLAASFFEEKA
ncbi:MAG: ApbE-like protein thiamine biosynthesis lipoprotein [Candidatus Saccharibacteria bacterium]|nr:ApbE-like protein thiamine biosynthesis lipoprotein [Candidatus Saccharibacteria bacterium]